MDDLAARLLVAALALLALGAVAARRRLVANVRAAASSSALAPGKAGGGEDNGGPSPSPAMSTPRPRWSAWAAVPPDLHETETGRIIALSSVALRAHAAGALVDLRGAVDRDATPDALVLAALEEIAAPWRAWPNQPPPPSDPPAVTA